MKTVARPTPVSVVLRSHNDMPLVAETLEALRQQTIPIHLTVFENASTDGTREVVERYADRIVDVPKGDYVPGRVLNQAMEATKGEIVVFLNSDCTPQHREWLERLIAGFATSETAAVFGRQIPRPDCHPLLAKDTEDTYGNGSRQARWRHCFSMASSAIRRSVWQHLRFDESLGYSEDIDWSWRARQSGYAVKYMADSVVMHSHNYTLRQIYRRHRGEGKAEAAIFDWDRWNGSVMRYSILPYIRQVTDDCRYSMKQGELAAAFYSPVLRMAQLLGRRSGFTTGSRTNGGNR